MKNFLYLMCWSFTGFTFLPGSNPVQAVLEIRCITEDRNTVFLSGNHHLLGNWDDGAVPMNQIDDSTFTFQVTVPENTRLEYKFTLGTWDTEALDDRGLIPGNHVLVVAGDTVVTHRVRQWKSGVVDAGKDYTGTVHEIRKFYSQQLDNVRTLRIWLPPSYSEEPERNYPVLYLHDGQNVFAPVASLSGDEWHLDESATGLIAENRIHEIIMVAIDNTSQRRLEYSPVHLGERYSRFLIETVKPYIDGHYQTKPGKPFTAVAGSSMGGLISFHLAWEYPDVFSMAGCLSPAFMVDENEIVERVRKSAEFPQDLDLLIFNGTVDLEARLLPAIHEMKEILDEKGMPVHFRIIEGAGHSESDWAEQSEDMLIRFFGN